MPDVYEFVQALLYAHCIILVYPQLFDTRER